ncbi:potassium-transporting ATPase subunit KdpC [Paraburkholderia caballeronis]|uniref:Potassium-transporting ATPase KdpC subunit n=1 Tax=Paraburkholderia caballeronis TaxID=416943 RepID=A0A1H7W009_9BURK|nr:potassium-transporting ATPase subunit KdpC [Paraburkholderia caballeronis]PXW22764.1 K+-transporting ATPase ATPase C chain [Paraburkholderia caballeronis]PXW96867.1 K+-transporting ATPase ATPase C chain [Paraburkholderia caballeronis]RAJ93494.1 K+-transporting ATPase ATPase C chain [Paraburkholderia caballeronis]SEC74853.1 K+-transporting ATPase ATPase C chain [Paraburkholderia caballeronis]SEM14826.1 K+-transporting ATPase ATPase C chain [Paraburkholderia caballeronis]
MKSILRPSLVLLAVMTVATGIVYPAVVTAVSQAAFPHQANGSLVEHGGKTVGSALLGQQFDAPYYFWGRLSATSPNPYNAQASSGSNLGPTNPALADEVNGRLAALHAADPSNTAPVPVDLVTSSGSGLDPDISPAAAAWQAGRVAKARGLAREQVDSLIAQSTAGRQWGIFGEPRVNVLKLNLALDDLKPLH